ncbi:hypothetical protein, partial [Emticicia sp.]|uniref:hypothetical protein n=1 Tax=Emticicia sp. TaxID=1930953 RepID=UPI003752D7B5
MKKNIFYAILIGFVQNLSAQNILLDKQVEAGELILFPDIFEPNSYYYLPNKISLGKQSDGSPQFSFLRYVQNVGTGADEST